MTTPLSPPLITPSGLPDWMILFAFIASLCLTVLIIIEIILRLLRKPAFDFRLTRDTFVRLIERGECIYAYGVLVSYDTGALIQSVEATLIKSDNPTKQFPLNIVSVGEKFRSNEGSALHYFHSSSPLAFIPDNRPQHIVYLCSQETYAEAIRNHFMEFTSRLYQIKEQNMPVDDSNVDSVSSEIESVVHNSCSKIMEQIQIEPGEYTLTVGLKYRQKSAILRNFVKKTVTSSVQFTVDSNVKELLRFQLRKLLETQVLNFMTDQPPPMIYPEYAPLNAKEVE